MNNIGSIYLTTDKNIVEQTMYSNAAKVIILDETNPYPTMPVIMASVLLPSYEALTYMVDGDVMRFNAEYANYLSQVQPSNFIAVLIASLYKGTNLLLYAPEAEFEFIKPLLDIFISRYGIVVGLNNTPFCMIPDLEYLRLSIIYLYGYMDGYTYLRVYPEYISIYRDCLPKLIEEFNPYLEEYSEYDYTEYFNNFKAKIHHTNKELITPFKRG